LFNCDVELDDLHILGIARRLAKMKDPIEPDAHQEDDVGVLQCQGASRRDRQRMVVRHHPLAHRLTQERNLRELDKGAHLVQARDQAMPLPTRTSGRSPVRSDSMPLEILRQRLIACRVQAARKSSTSFSSVFPIDATDLGFRWPAGGVYYF
jgi:hypothetical protein